LSLGILIETSITSKENRAALVNGLTDMLRHLGDNDEAFVLSYDNNLVFETDLTTDPHQLEQALADIKPQKGAVLDDAVAFAAGHLARIAKNANRVLLVISDGRNVDSQTSPLRTSAEIHAAGVKIYCIGVGVDQADGRYRLQALSSSTGGHSDFIPDTTQFRRATEQIAQNMGIDFRF
jgi:Mg-chelatase subunit ChlD